MSMTRHNSFVGWALGWLVSAVFWAWIEKNSHFPDLLWNEKWNARGSCRVRIRFGRTCNIFRVHRVIMRMPYLRSWKVRWPNSIWLCLCKTAWIWDKLTPFIPPVLSHFCYVQLSDFHIDRLVAHGTEGAVFLARCQKRRHPNKLKNYAVKAMFNIFQLTTVTQVGIATCVPWKIWANHNIKMFLICLDFHVVRCVSSTIGSTMCLPHFPHIQTSFDFWRSFTIASVTVCRTWNSSMLCGTMHEACRWCWWWSITQRPWLKRLDGSVKHANWRWVVLCSTFSITRSLSIHWKRSVTP